MEGIKTLRTTAIVSFHVTMHMTVEVRNRKSRTFHIMHFLPLSSTIPSEPLPYIVVEHVKDYDIQRVSGSVRDAM